MIRISAVIPAFNEERSISAVVRSLDRSIISEVIVADNASTDDTARLAAEAGATVVSARERGYGAACARALEAISPHSEVVIFLDADGSDDPADLESLIAPILDDTADLVIGSRALGRVEPGALTPQQRFGNWLATRLIRWIFHHSYTDLGPYRVIRRSLLDAIDMQDRRFGWTVEMQIRAVQLNARIREVPAAYRKRIGRSKISGTVSGVILAGWWILYTIARHALFPRGKTGEAWGRGSHAAAFDSANNSNEADSDVAQALLPVRGPLKPKS